MPYYGQNGFYLPFKDNSSTRALGFDFGDQTAARANASVFGNAQISTAQSKFGGSSALFDGNGDYLTVPSNSGFDFGTGNFTIELWVYPKNTGTAGAQYGHYFSINNQSTFALKSYNPNYYLFANGATVVSSSTAPVLNAWAHLALVRNGSSIKIYINGIESGSATTSSSFGSNSTSYIGTAPGTTSEFLNGNIDDLRIYKGIAKYTANFTPPTSALAIGEDDPYWQYCVLAMPMDGTNASTAFPVYAPNAWTPNNFSVTAGAGNDSVIDVPTRYADGANNRGNYSTWNPLMLNAGTGLYGTVTPSYEDGNLLLIQPNNDTNGAVSTSTIKAFGKFYAEFSRTVTNSGNYNSRVGIQYADKQVVIGTTNDFSTSVYYQADGTKLVYSSTSSSYGATWTTNDIIGVALDTISGTVEFFKNGVSQGVITGIIQTEYYFAVNAVSIRNGTGDRFIANFGQRPFAYTPPSGFKALNTYNLAGGSDITLSPVAIEYLVIAGGGGGESSGGGGGGGGGYRSSVSGESSGGGASAESALSLSTGTTYSVTVGAGGVGTHVTGTPAATSGVNSIFATITSTGGGKGGRVTAAATGGSGGGGYTANITGGSGTANQGYAGGDGLSGYANGAGGGGADAVGSNATSTRGGNGGAGVSSSITGSSVCRAGGGGGGTHATGSSGASTATCGGGAGGTYNSSANASSGGVNTGGGGGGGGGRQGVIGSGGGAGGSGVVIIRFPKSYTLNVGAGLTYSQIIIDDKKVVQFTAGTGTISFT